MSTAQYIGLVAALVLVASSGERNMERSAVYAWAAVALAVIAVVWAVVSHLA